MTDSFLLLVATILDSVAASHSVSDAVLLRLHALFGPMLMSALQLIDKREVVQVGLPGGRYVYQVTGSTGLPYTLYLHIPAYEVDTNESAEQDDPDRPSSPTPTHHDTEATDDHLDPFLPSTPRRQPSSKSPQSTLGIDPARQAERQRHQERARAERVARIADDLRGLYCPCVGFMFNSLAGEKNLLCKHLLAVIIAHHTSQSIRTYVRFDGLVDLLHLHTPSGTSGY